MSGMWQATCIHDRREVQHLPPCLPKAGCFADYKEKVIDLLAGDDGERGDDGGGEGDGESAALKYACLLTAALNHSRVSASGPCVLGRERRVPVKCTGDPAEV